MSNSLNQVWIHAIWATKYREHLIEAHVEDLIFGFIREQFSKTGCKVLAVNGTGDHVHCLFQLNRNRSVAHVIKQVKGSSSRYINEQRLNPDNFSWQRGYSAYSVSESMLDTVKGYIENQKMHHKIDITN